MVLWKCPSTLIGINGHQSVDTLGVVKPHTSLKSRLSQCEVRRRRPEFAGVTAAAEQGLQRTKQGRIHCGLKAKELDKLHLGFPQRGGMEIPRLVGDRDPVNAGPHARLEEQHALEITDHAAAPGRMDVSRPQMGLAVVGGPKELRVGCREDHGARSPQGINRLRSLVEPTHGTSEGLVNDKLLFLT